MENAESTKKKLLDEAIKAAAEAAEKEKTEGETSVDDAGTDDGAECADRTEEDLQAGDASADAGDTSKEDKGSSSKSFFSKKEKKDKRDEQIAELNDRILRNLAEFDNFRKRTEKEKSQMFEIGAKSIVEKILPTLDNFERGLATVPEDKQDDPFVQGMEKIYKQLISSLEEAGVKAIEAVGKEFDPNLHNAVMHEDNPELGENIISAELQKGYMYRDSVVRHSMVKVAN